MVDLNRVTTTSDLAAGAVTWFMYPSIVPSAACTVHALQRDRLQRARISEVNITNNRKKSTFATLIRLLCTRQSHLRIFSGWMTNKSEIREVCLGVFLEGKLY